jgi:hypothetical protein
MARKNTRPRVRKVDQVIAMLQEKLGVSKRAPKKTTQPWLDDAVDPPVVRTFLNGWYSAAELHEIIALIDTRKRPKKIPEGSGS